MARRRQKDSPLGTVIALAGLFLAYVVPFLLGLGWIVAELWAALTGQDRLNRIASLRREARTRAATVDDLWQQGFDQERAAR